MDGEGRPLAWNRGKTRGLHVTSEGQSRMRASEAASRLTGFSTPFFGFSWEPATSDIAVVRRVITFLESRRVLYMGYPAEMPDQCVESVIQIRDMLTKVIGAGGIADKVENPLRIMRRYCNHFLNRVGRTEDPQHAGFSRRLYHDARYRIPDWAFSEALGEFRAGIGLQVAILSAAAQVDVEEPLANFLPPAPAP